MVNFTNTSKVKPLSAGMNTALQFIRIFVGVLFIFSGLVKANDPSGLAYKMQEFFEVWQWHSLSDYALILSVVMIVFEIIAGVALLLGYAFRVFSFLLLLLMLFFTYLTAYAVFSGKIKECGCFGDCIPLKAMQSFIKDIVLLVLVIILFLARKHIHPLFNKLTGAGLMLASLLVSFFIQRYALLHLPYVDCLPFKQGNHLWNEMQMPENATPDVYQTTYALKHQTTGETKTMIDEEYLSSGIWNDENWKIEGEPVTKLIKKGENAPKIQDFIITDFEGNNHTEYVLTGEGYTFLWFVRDVDEVATENIEYIRNLVKQTEQQGVNFYMLTSNNQTRTDQFLIEHDIQVIAVLVDGTASKTAMRSNPGLMLLKEGVVQKKWSYKDYPKGFVIGSEGVIQFQ